MKKEDNAEKTRWLIDHIHSSINFKVRHLKISNIRGAFKRFDATIYTEGKDFQTADIHFWMDAASIDTGDAKRDAHLVSSDFFDAENYKKITFNSISSAQSTGKGKQELKGELTMKGITKMIILNAEFGGIILDTYGNEKAGLTITGTIKRSDWGLLWNTVLESGGFLISDEVTISCELEVSNARDQELKLETVIDSMEERLTL